MQDRERLLLDRHDAETRRLLGLLSRFAPSGRRAIGGARRTVPSSVRQRLAYHLAAYQLAADAAHLSVPRRDWMCRAVLEADDEALVVLSRVLLDELSEIERAAS